MSSNIEIRRDNDGLGVMGPGLRRDDSKMAPGRTYRVNSFIAPSSPSRVSGNMRSENSRRITVVDSE